MDLGPDQPDQAEFAENVVTALRNIGCVEASIDQVCTEISDLTAAVRELTELIKEVPMFPREPWGRTRRVFGWCVNR